MKKYITILISVFFLISISTLNAADDKGNATSLVKNAIKFFNANGKEKALQAVTAGKYKQGELYVFCYDMNGVIVAHPENKALVGKNMLEVPDVDGKLFRKDIIEVAKTKGSGWVDYKYKNPKTKKLELKTTYLEKAGDTIFCCGIYK